MVVESGYEPTETGQLIQYLNIIKWSNNMRFDAISVFVIK